MPFNPPNFMNPNAGRMPNLFGNLFRPPQEDLASQAIRQRTRIPSPMMQEQPEEFPGLQTPQLDAYSKYLETMPTRGNNTFMQKLIAALGGASTAYKGGAGAGIETAQGYLDLPYRKNMEEWMTKGAGLKDAATLENRNLAQQNAQFKSILQNQVGMGRNEVLGQGVEAKKETELARIDARIQEVEMEIAGALQKQGMAAESAMAVAKKRGEDMRAAAGIRASATLGAAGIQADAARDVAATTGQSRETVADITGQSRVAAAEIGGTGQPNAAFENREDQAWLAANATKYPDLIKGDKGKFYPVPPSSSFGQAEKEAKYNQMMAEMQQARTVRRTPRTPARTAPKPAGMIRMQAPDGTIKEVPEAEAQWYESRGARRVQ